MFLKNGCVFFQNDQIHGNLIQTIPIRSGIEKNLELVNGQGVRASAQRIESAVNHVETFNEYFDFPGGKHLIFVASLIYSN